MEAGPPPTQPPHTTYAPAVEREPLSLGEIREIWPLLAHGDRIEAFLLLPRDEAEDFFFGLPAHDQADLVLGVPAREQRSWMRSLPPDDAADLMQSAPMNKRETLLVLLDEATRREVTALLAYAVALLGWSLVKVLAPGFFARQDTRTPMRSAVQSLGVTIGEGAWTGAGAKILDGVSIGAHAVIGAGAVVRESVAAGAIAVGVPARVVSMRTPENQ